MVELTVSKCSEQQQEEEKEKLVVNEIQSDDDEDGAATTTAALQTLTSGPFSSSVASLAASSRCIPSERGFLFYCNFNEFKLPIDEISRESQSRPKARKLRRRPSTPEALSLSRHGKRLVYGYTELKIAVLEIGIVGLHAENLGIESVWVDGEPTEFEYYPH
jgi:hypothetical protein